MASENSVRLDAETLRIAEELVQSDDWFGVRIAYQRDEPFAIGRDRHQISAFRVALAEHLSVDISEN